MTIFANEFDYDTYDIANDTYMIPFIMIRSFLAFLDPEDLPLCKEGIHGAYDPTRDWNSMSNQEKYQQDKVLMMEFFTEVVTVARCIPKYPVCDEFIRGMQELDRTREIPMYLAFTAQVFLDIHHILREKVYSAHEKCMLSIGIMDEDIRLHLDFHTKLRISNWPASNDEAMRRFREKMKVSSLAHFGEVLTHYIPMKPANTPYCSGSRKILCTKSSWRLSVKWEYLALRPSTAF